jgi:diguanylate cyclase (GGDEF)-like protein
MSARDGRRGAAMLIMLVAIVPLAIVSAQSAPDLTPRPDALGGIPPPAPVTIQPPIVGAYGALIAAAMLGILYLYRGRAFIVYWIGSWLFIAASLLLRAQGYQDPRLGSVMLGLGQLLGVWSAGLTLLAANAFPGGRLLLNVPVKVAAVTAVWFLVIPFQLPLSVVLATGSGAMAILFGWAALTYLRLAPRTRYLGAWVLGSGMLIMCATNAAALGVRLGALSDVNILSRLVALNFIINMFVVLGMHVLVFEDMTHELRRTNRDLAQAHQEVKSLAITDALTGCHNRRFFEEIERREIQRHRRYDAPLSVVFTDVNHFKQINDTLGHETGDRVLKTIGAFLRKQVRESDYVIRWGGDEFLMLLTCTYGEAQRKANELKVAFERERQTLSLPDGLGLSIGVASASVDAESLGEAIRLADGRMYRDKLGERN